MAAHGESVPSMTNMRAGRVTDKRQSLARDGDVPVRLGAVAAVVLHFSFEIVVRHVICCRKS